MTGAARSMQPRARRIRALAVLAFAAAAALGCFAVATVNLLAAAETDAAADRREASVEQLERRVRSLPPAPSAEASAKGGIYLTGATPTLARAELQRLLVETVERLGARVVEAQDDRPDEALDLTANDRVRLRMTFDATNEALIGVLAAVETGTPLLVVERIEIRRLATGADADPEDPILRVAVVVAGDGKRSSR